MYTLAMTINHRYWEWDHKRHHARQAEKEALESHSQKQGKASTSGTATALQNKANLSLAASPTKNSSSKLSLSLASKKQPNTLQVDFSSKLASNCFQETLRKIESDLQDSTQTEGHVEPLCTAMSSIWLNTSTLFNPHSLFVFLTSLLILGQDHLNKILFWALVDFRSTHCFVDSKFVDNHHLKTSTTPPVALYLFDGSSNSTISKIANLSIIFSTSDYINLDFYVTPLDSFCSLSLNTTGLPDTIH